MSPSSTRLTREFGPFNWGHRYPWPGPDCPPHLERAALRARHGVDVASCAGQRKPYHCLTETDAACARQEGMRGFVDGPVE